MSSEIAVIFCGGMVLWLIAAYAGGIVGGIAGALAFASAWIFLALGHGTDPSLLAAEALTGMLILWVSARWVLRHRGWLGRMQKSSRQIAAERALAERGMFQLREDLAARGTDVARFSKHSELITRMAQRPQALAAILGDLLTHLFGGVRWALYLVDGEGRFRPMEGRGDWTEPPAGDLASKEPELKTDGSVWLLKIPLWRLHERVGLLLVSLPAFSTDQRPRILSEASELAIQLIFPATRARLQQELHRACRTDALTGFYRPAFFEERLREEVARARTFHRTFAILLLELDPAREEVLPSVGQRLKDSLYETDILAKLEGPRFLGLLPEAHPIALKTKVEQLRHQIENQLWAVGLEAVRVHCRAGIAHFPQDGDTAKAILAAAQRALEAAKDSGRGVIEAATVSL